MRFAFGRNWRAFVHKVDADLVNEAEQGLTRMLGPRLDGLRFLDVGSGSGLSSVAASNLGAEVRAFDFDADSVSASAALRDKFGQQWRVEQGDILNLGYVEKLGEWDIVYSWGVLHHTGDMWKACEHVARVVAPGGRLFIALYNDQGWQSRIWWFLKWSYNRSVLLSPVVLALTFVLLWGGKALLGLTRGRLPWELWRQYGRERGMSPWTDVVDWAGGFPYEVARPAAVVQFFADRGFTVEDIAEVGNRLGCNEFVLRRAHG